MNSPSPSPPNLLSLAAPPQVRRRQRRLKRDLRRYGGVPGMAEAEERDEFPPPGFTLDTASSWTRLQQGSGHASSLSSSSPSTTSKVPLAAPPRVGEDVDGDDGREAPDENRTRWSGANLLIASDDDSDESEDAADGGGGRAVTRRGGGGGGDGGNVTMTDTRGVARVGLGGLWEQLAARGRRSGGVSDKQ